MVAAPSADAKTSPWRAAFALATRRDALFLLLLCTLARPVTRMLMSSVEVRWWPRLEVTVGVAGLGVALIGLLLEVLVWMLVAKIALEGLHAARRDLPAGDPNHDVAPVADRQALSHLLLWFSVALVLYAVALLFGTGWALLLFLAVGGVMPAMVVLMALEGSVRHALNPMAWRELIVRLGAGHAPVAMAFAAIAGAVAASQILMSLLLPAAVAVFAGRLQLLFAMTLGYCRLGGLLWEQHAALGLEVARPIRRPTLASAEEDAVMREVDALILQERVPDAVQALRSLIQRSGASAPVHERYRQLLVGLGDGESLARHAAAYVCTLLALGQERRALALFVESRDRDPGFFLEGPGESTRLLDIAQSAGHSRAALELAAGILDRFPGHERAVASGLAAAHLLAEKFGREAEAKALLLHLRDRYPGHPLQGEVERALETPSRP